MLDIEFKSVVDEIKNQINNTQYEIFQNANRSLLNLYYNIGKIIANNSSWGNKFIDDLALELKITFPKLIRTFGFRETSLR